MRNLLSLPQLNIVCIYQIVTVSLTICSNNISHKYRSLHFTLIFVRKKAPAQYKCTHSDNVQSQTIIHRTLTRHAVQFGLAGSRRKFCCWMEKKGKDLPGCPEAEFQDIIGTKVLRVFLLCCSHSPLVTNFTLP